MKRILLVIVLVLCGALMHVSADDVKVTMKNGTVFTGELKEFVPTDHVTVIVAGIETTISISEVASVEKANAHQTPPAQQQNNDDSRLQYGKFTVTDTKEYPDSFVLRIGNQELTMVLVRGGWFNMGYDGRHSLSWDTEPVHRVSLSSFYVSKQVLNRNTVDQFMNNKKINDSNKPQTIKKREDVETVIERIKETTGKPYRLLTEAEWEYTALMPFAHSIFGSKKQTEWCFDIWAKYGAEDQVNPQGPTSGNNHVLRSFAPDNDKWKRTKTLGKKNDYSFPEAYVRLAISADAIQ